MAFYHDCRIAEHTFVNRSLVKDLPVVAATASLTPTRRDSVFSYILLCIKGICYPNRSLFYSGLKADQMFLYFSF